MVSMSSQNLELSSSSSNSSSTCCCDECGRVKNEMRNVRDELRFLTHQVSQLMHVFAVQHCPCHQCSSKPKCQKSECAHVEAKNDPKNDQVVMNEDQEKNGVKIELTESIDSFDQIVRKRSNPDSVIGVDQLLPKLLAKNQSIDQTDEKSRKRSSTSSASSEIDDDDFVSPVKKLSKNEFAHAFYETEDRRHMGPFEQSCFVTKPISVSTGLVSVELPKNCVDSFDMHMENGYVNSNLLPTVPSTIFYRPDDDRSHVKGFSPNLPIAGPGLPLVSYGPKSSTFFCGVCKREFSNVYYKRHMIVHANARPHVCDVCGKRFNERSNMMKHRQRLHVA